MYHLVDITDLGRIEDVFAEALKLLLDNEPRQARDLLDTFLATEAGDFVVDFDADGEPVTATVADHDLASVLAEEAISLIDSGLLLDAARRVESFCAPKWGDLADCEEAYAAATPPPVVAPLPAPAPCFVQASFQI